ncbi:MAG: NTP transferase domain-containing protein [Chitinophagaceae bacterium]|nr:NTP transferase domain-containing protein [Oligoflexus sp.]
MKALLLAAGYGTRLKPLTDHVPKPLTLFMGSPILDIVYSQVVRAGIQNIAVNTHHLSERIRLHIQNSPLYKHPVHISYEPDILGTGGSINPLRSWLGGEDLLIFNGDIVTSLDTLSFIAAFEKAKPLAGMVLIPHKAGTTPVYILGDQVVSIGEAVPGALKKTFAGIHIISDAFIREMPTSGFYSVIDTYQKLLKAKGSILAFEHNSYWADLGIPRDYLEAHQSLLHHPDRARLCESLCLDTGPWRYAETQRTLFIGCEPIAGFKDSFVFGPIACEQPVQFDVCIVYPHSQLSKHSHEKYKIVTGYALLNMMS